MTEEGSWGCCSRGSGRQRRLDNRRLPSTGAGTSVAQILPLVARSPVFPPMFMGFQPLILRTRPGRQCDSKLAGSEHDDIDPVIEIHVVIQLRVFGKPQGLPRHFL